MPRKRLKARPGFPSLSALLFHLLLLRSITNSIAVSQPHSIAAINHTIAALATAVPTATATLPTAVATAIETRKHARPASRNAAGENIDAPGPRAVAAPVQTRAHVAHFLRLRGAVVFGVGHWCVVHLDLFYFEFKEKIEIEIEMRW